MIPEFKKTISRIKPHITRLETLVTLQVNLGNRCNQRCSHCHHAGGPEGEKIMPREVMDRVISFLRTHPGLVLDITGGCPELHPFLEYFVEEAEGLVSRLMVRTNLTVLTEETASWIPGWFREHGVVLMASLPCYTEETVNQQRGDGVYRKSIEALAVLNDLGYGRSLELNLIYNPGSDFLPAPQQQLEEDYRRLLFQRHGVTFTNLLTIVNAPLGRFKNYLDSCGRTDDYYKLLFDNFNPEAAESIMCRSLVNVDWRGVLYNCDFNQASGLPVRDSRGIVMTIDTLPHLLNREHEIVMGDHCYCCTAGAGSSCTGELVQV